MTGSSNVRLDAEPWSVEVILRSFNSRSLDIKCRLPDELLAMEQEIHGLISQNLNRGRIELSYKIKGSLGAKKNLFFDHEKAWHLLHQFTAFIEKNPVLNKELTIGDLLRSSQLITISEPEACQESLKDL